MIDRKLFEKVNSYMRVYFCGGTTMENIQKFSAELGVELPTSYKNFLLEFGAGGVGVYNVKGIEKNDFSSMVNWTKKYRELINLPESYVVFSYRSADGFEFITCLDTARMNNGECPVVKYDLLTNSIDEYQSTFDDAFNDGLMEVYNMDILPNISEKPNTKEFPAGLGYKGCWMTVIGSNQETIVNALNLNGLTKMDYFEGLELVKSKSCKVMVTADFDNKNYVLLHGGDVSLDEKFVSKLSAGLPEVYGYITHRVSEAHGFFKVVKGEIQRIYYRDEEQIISVGEPLPEEKKNKVKLPDSFDAAFDKKCKWTKYDEKLILKLAETSSLVERDTYPYDKVSVGDLQ